MRAQRAAGFHGVVRWAHRLGHGVLALGLASCGDSTEPGVRPVEYGSIEVSVLTDGGDLDQDGYLVMVDSLHKRFIGISGTVLLEVLEAGSHLVSLSGVDANCDVEAPHPRPVTVAPNQVAAAAFAVHCHATGIAVHVVQSGADFDSDGYTVLLDGGSPQSLFADYEVRYGRLTPGWHTLSITGVAPNCAVDGPAHVVVPVVWRTVATVAFSVICTAVTGSLEISVVTSGEDIDPDGYRARLSDGSQRLLSSNGTRVISGLIAGQYTVQLEDLTGNCQVVGNPQPTVEVEVGGVASIGFQVTCTRTEVLAFARADPTGCWGCVVADLAGFGEIIVARVDGAGTRTLTTGANPAWSPDGRTLAFAREECDPYYWWDCHVVGLFTTSVDSPTPVQITTGDDGTPDWSPDGTQIVFARAGRLYLINAQGGAPSQLAPSVSDSASNPDWSPNGSQIAFGCRHQGQDDICVVNADGTGFRRIVEDLAVDIDPAWSPDGSRLAFVTDRQGGLKVALIRIDGTDLRVITDGLQPTWSPNGTRLAFRRTLSPSGIAVVNVDGSGLVQLTTGAYDVAPAWRP